MKVMFFDYWTVGIHNFLPIFQALRELGHEASLLHLGSLRDPGCPTTETIGGMVCKDFSQYGNSIRRAMLLERPDLVLGLNIGLTVDRTVNRICRSLGIKTAFMMHGIKAVGDDLNLFIEHQNSHWSPLRRLKKVPKYAGLSLSYLAAIGRDSPLELLAPSTYGHFLQLMTSPGAAHERPWPHKDVYCDIALVYAKVYADSMIQEKLYPAERVRIVGNPNLDDVFALLADPRKQELALAELEMIGVRAGHRAAVYMEDAFVEQGIGGWTDETRVSLLRQVAKAVNAAGYDLVVKMHPGANPAGVQEAFRDHKSVHVVLKADLAALAWACVATIGHASTTLMLPVAIGRPLIVPAWAPGLDGYSYYVGAGVAIPATSPDELAGILADPERANVAPAGQRAQFVDEYLAYTDGRSLNRIIEELTACASAAGSRPPQ
jgi:hypothetical protein